MTGPGAWLITEAERLPELPGLEFDDVFVPDPAAQATSSGSVRRR